MSLPWVTVPGTANNSSQVTISPTPGDALLLAQQVGVLLGTAATVTATLTVTSISGSIPSLGTAEAFLHGPSSSYIIAENGGSLYASDTVANRDSTQILPGANLIRFSDGMGIFDPTGMAEDIARLYQGLLHRAPDIAGLQAWTAAVDTSALSLTAVANAFIASAEFNNTVSNSTFVQNLYMNSLGRAPSVSEAGAWSNLLASGVSRGVVALGIADSPEGRAHSTSTAGDSNDGTVYRLYQTVFGRAPDVGGGAYWSSALAAGSTVGQVAQGIVGSTEFQRDYSASSASAFVTALYQNALHRTPSAPELQAWVNILQAGASEASVIVGFSDSAESRADTANVTHANWVFVPSTPQTNELLLNGPGGRNTTVPSGYDYVVVKDATSDTLTGSNVVIATTNSVGGTFFLSGTSSLAATGSDNTVNATGNYDLSFGGTGSNVVNAAGSGTVAMSAGVATVNVSGPNDLVLRGNSDMTVTASGNSGGLTINGSYGLGLFGPGTGKLDFVGDASTAIIIGGTGGSNLSAGIGGLVATLNGATGDTVTGVAGSTSTIFGTTGTNVTLGGAGNFDYTAGAGNVTLNAAAATGNVSADLSGSALADSVTLGSGNDTVIVGAGAETLDAGSGNNLFQFVLGQTGPRTNYTINDSAANLANDTFNFVSYGGLPAESGNTITLSDSSVLTFTHLTNVNQIGHITISSH